MPKLNSNRSLEYLRRALIHLHISLEAHKETEDLAPSAAEFIKQAEKLIESKNQTEDDLARSMALLIAADQNLDTTISVLNMYAKTADKLHPGHDVKSRIFPDGVTKFLKKSGKGIKDILPELEKIKETLIELKAELPDFDNYSEEFFNALDTVKLQLKNVESVLEEEKKINELINEFKEDTDNLYLDLELHLKRIYKRNRKLISSFFKI